MNSVLRFPFSAKTNADCPAFAVSRQRFFVRVTSVLRRSFQMFRRRNG